MGMLAPQGGVELPLHKKTWVPLSMILNLGSGNIGSLLRSDGMTNQYYWCVPMNCGNIPIWFMLTKSSVMLENLNIIQ